MCFKQEGTISTQSCNLLKFIDQFIILRNNISSTESDVNRRLEKVWNVMDRLSII